MNNASWVLSYLLEKTRYADNIKPFISAPGMLFVADGYFTTTIAYQSLLMKQIEMNKLIELGDLFDIPRPDFAIFLDVDPEVAIKRKKKEEGHEEGPDMFEKSVGKQKKLQKIFKQMVEENIYCPWYKVDGNGKPEEVTKNIIKILKTKGIV
jgi:thymidylate kinase